MRGFPLSLRDAAGQDQAFPGSVPARCLRKRSLL